LGTFSGVTLVDDYAHHPTELRATLTALRQRYPGRRLWCVFQPHQARRTGALLDEFADSLHNADAVLLADIYHAREGDAADTVTSADLAERIGPGPRICETLPSREAIVDRLASNCADGDVVVACGAGDIGKVLHELCQRI
jgi:UDP-N-acetylmuramate--alanine ligase